MSGGSGRYVDTTLVNILLFFYLTIVPDEKNRCKMVPSESRTWATSVKTAFNRFQL